MVKLINFAIMLELLKEILYETTTEWTEEEYRNVAIAMLTFLEVRGVAVDRQA